MLRQELLPTLSLSQKNNTGLTERQREKKKTKTKEEVERPCTQLLLLCGEIIAIVLKL